ncbi:V-set and immunoglobulin domain-containing protein 1-like [Gouania willdenowi]|uniref:V-set and immunoglobulin domain-containing protein 1-like n=1 Tax=Gouania willdenowi TaxID=441366 RepID=UPI00105599EA|nr:V-set and immunoglobulin domain-containing protein 1-like [Gouania willdenowi]
MDTDQRLLLFLCLLLVFADQRIISVEPGHDVTLPCEVPDGGTVAVVEWRRTDLKDRYVLLYRNKVDPRYQLQSYRDRVDLQIKNRNISLILKNVIPDDEGTYECRVFQRNSPRQQRSVPGSVIGGDPVCSISLRVGPPGTPEKQNQYRVKNTSERLRSSLYLCMLVLLVFVYF